MVLTQGLPWAVVAALVSASGAAAGAWIAAYLGVRLGSGYVVGVWGLRDPVLRRRLWLYMRCMTFFAFFTWLASFAVNRIEWRGLTFTLDKRTDGSSGFAAPTAADCDRHETHNDRVDAPASHTVDVPRCNPLK